MRRYVWSALAALALLYCAPTARAQTFYRIPADAPGYCFRLGAPGDQAISASCTVTVYAHGTVNIATIYSTDSGGAQANPFAAATNGTWLFYGAVGVAYDIRLSGGTPALTPYTISNVLLTTGGTLTVGNLPPLFTTSVMNPDTSPTVSFSLSSAAANTVFGRCTGSLGVPSYCSLTNAMLPAPGSSGQVIYNTSGLFDASQDMTWDNTSKTFSIKVSGSPIVRLLSDSGAGKLLFGTGSAPFIRDNGGSGWVWTQQNGQDLVLGTVNDQQAFLFGGDNVLPHGAARFGIGAAEGALYLNDGTSSAGLFLGPQLQAGNATPTGNFSGRIGSLYMRADGGAGTALYLKESGTGTSGWQTFAMQDDAQTITNKALDDTTTTVINTISPTKAFKFDVSGVTVATTRTYAAPDASGTLSLGDVYTCGTVVTCSPTVRLTPHWFFGSAPLSSGTPSTATIIGVAPAYTSSATYKCFLDNQTTRTNVVFVSSYASGSSFVITGPDTVSDVVAYQCLGY